SRSKARLRRATDGRAPIVNTQIRRTTRPLASTVLPAIFWKRGPGSKTPANFFELAGDSGCGGPKPPTVDSAGNKLLRDAIILHPGKTPDGVEVAMRSPTPRIGAGRRRSVVDIAFLMLIIEISPEQPGTRADCCSKGGVAPDGAEHCPAGGAHRAAAYRA